MHGYILTHSRVLRESICQLWVFNRGDVNISASAVPYYKDTFETERNEKLQHIKLFKQLTTIWKGPFYEHNRSC